MSVLANIYGQYLSGLGHFDSRRTIYFIVGLESRKKTRSSVKNPLPLSLTLFTKELVLLRWLESIEIMDHQKEQTDALLSSEARSISPCDGFERESLPFQKAKAKTPHTWTFILLGSIALLSMIMNLIAAVRYFVPNPVSARDVPSDYSRISLLLGVDFIC